MNRIFGTSLALGVGLVAVAAEVRGQDRPAAPAEQYKALVKESQSRYDAAQEEAFRSVPKGGILPDDKRTTLVGLAYRSKYEQAPKLLALAERYPQDPVALDALTEAVRQVNTVPYPV